MLRKEDVPQSSESHVHTMYDAMGKHCTFQRLSEYYSNAKYIYT